MTSPASPDQGPAAARPFGTPASNTTAAALLLALLAAIVVPSFLTLSTVRRAIIHDDVGDTTPYGYTVSLLLFLVPIAILTPWFFRNHPPGSFRRRAFWWTVGLLVPVGFLLDLLFGNLFFRFPNPGATLGVYVPGFSFHTGGIVWDLPIEEFVFYVSGFVAILLVYNWCNEVWVPAYGVPDYGDTSRHPPYVVDIEWRALWWGVGVFVLAVIYKKLFAPIVLERSYREGFPLYLAFLLVASIGPALLLGRSARPFINWRAFSVTLLWVLLTSLLWEATLASPYGWWHYEYRWMMGLHINAWASLPVEAVLLWIAVAYTTTTVFETIKVLMHMKRPLPDALFGTGAEPPEGG